MVLYILFYFIDDWDDSRHHQIWYFHITRTRNVYEYPISSINIVSFIVDNIWMRMVDCNLFWNYSWYIFRQFKRWIWRWPPRDSVLLWRRMRKILALSLKNVFLWRNKRKSIEYICILQRIPMKLYSTCCCSNLTLPSVVQQKRSWVIHGNFLSGVRQRELNWFPTDSPGVSDENYIDIKEVKSKTWKNWNEFKMEDNVVNKGLRNLFTVQNKFCKMVLLWQFICFIDCESDVNYFIHQKMNKFHSKTYIMVLFIMLMIECTLNLHNRLCLSLKGLASKLFFGLL